MKHFIQGRSKVFTTGQARFNLNTKLPNASMADKFSSSYGLLAFCCVLFLVYQVYKSLYHSVYHLIFAQ